jgi:hypothetical protein
LAIAVSIVRSPAGVDSDVAADSPADFLQPSRKRHEAGLVGGWPRCEFSSSFRGARQISLMFRGCHLCFVIETFMSCQRELFLGNSRTARGGLASRQPQHLWSLLGRAPRPSSEVLLHGWCARVLSFVFARRGWSIGTDLLRLLVLRVLSDRDEREQDGEGNPNINAHQSSPGGPPWARFIPVGRLLANAP